MVDTSVAGSFPSRNATTVLSSRQPFATARRRYDDGAGEGSARRRECAALRIPPGRYGMMGAAMEEVGFVERSIALGHGSSCVLQDANWARCGCNPDRIE